MKGRARCRSTLPCLRRITSVFSSSFSAAVMTRSSTGANLGTYANPGIDMAFTNNCFVNVSGLAAAPFVRRRVLARADGWSTRVEGKISPLSFLASLWYRWSGDSSASFATREDSFSTPSFSSIEYVLFNGAFVPFLSVSQPNEGSPQWPRSDGNDDIPDAVATLACWREVNRI